MHKLGIAVDELRAADTDKYRTLIMVFINCLLTPNNNAEKRTAIRDEFAGQQSMTS